MQYLVNQVFAQVARVYTVVTLLGAMVLKNHPRPPLSYFLAISHFLLANSRTWCNLSRVTKWPLLWCRYKLTYILAVYVYIFIYEAYDEIRDLFTRQAISPKESSGIKKKKHSAKDTHT